MSCKCCKSKVCFDVKQLIDTDWDRKRVYRQRVMQALGMARAELDDSIECLLACAISLAHSNTLRRDFFYMIDELWDEADEIDGKRRG